MQRSVTRISGLFGLAIGMAVVGIATISMTGCSSRSQGDAQTLSNLPPAQMNQKIQADAQKYDAYRQAHPGTL